MNAFEQGRRRSADLALLSCGAQQFHEARQLAGVLLGRTRAVGHDEAAEHLRQARFPEQSAFAEKIVAEGAGEAAGSPPRLKKRRVFWRDIVPIVNVAATRGRKL